jgi:cell division protein FtsW
MQLQDGSGADERAFKYIMLVTAPIVALIVTENLSTAALICVVIFLMMFVGRIPMKQLGILSTVAFSAIFLVLTLVMVVGKEEVDTPEKPGTELAQAKETSSGVLHRANLWKTRILKFMDKKEIAAKDYDIDKNFQVGHANIAIASSGIIGKGPGNSTERDFLPQAFSDFIYAIVIEEMGIIGAIVVVFLYVVLLFRCARIASRCENNFPAFLVLGLAMLLVLQATINMLVAVGLMPVTGQPLPLISKGGTSTIINCAYIGAILSVSRSAKRTEEMVSRAS